MATGATTMLLVRRASSSRRHRCSISSGHDHFCTRTAACASHSMAVSSSRSKRRLHHAPHTPPTTTMTTNAGTIAITSRRCSHGRSLLASFSQCSMTSGLSGQYMYTGRPFSSTSSPEELQPQSPPPSSHLDAEAADEPTAIILEQDANEDAMLKDEALSKPAGPSFNIFEEVVEKVDGSAHRDPTTRILQEMMDSAESNLHRMLALADDLYEDEEEKEKARGKQHAGGNVTKRQHRRRRRVPLRERVEWMAERRRDEQSERGAEERILRLERRRKQWEEIAATTTTAAADIHMSKTNEKSAEGLGRKNALSYEHRTLIQGGGGGGGGEMSNDIPLADTDVPDSFLSDLLVPDMEDMEDMESPENTDLNDEFSNVMTAPNSNEHQTTDTEGPSAVQKPSLMDLLGDDFSFGPKSNDVRDSSKPGKQQKKEETYRPPSSLMDLLNENFNTPLEERSSDEANLDFVDERRPPGSLVDLLSENFSPYADEGQFTARLVDDVLNEGHEGTIADRSSETSHEDGDLVGLLNTDYNTDTLAEEETANISDTVNELLSLLICATENEWNEITNTAEPSLVEEAEREAGYLREDRNGTFPAKAMKIAEEIINGSNELNLKVDEINLALLNLAFMPPTLQSMELLVQVFKLLEENRRSGHKDVVPNAATYALLMVAFGDRGNDRQAAKFVCERMMKAMDEKLLVLDGNAIEVGARCLRKVGDVVNAEKLLSDSLGEAGSGVEVSPRVFHHVLALYKDDNLQEDGLRLLDVFINERSVDGSERKLDEFVKSLIRWPQRNRRGNRVALALHHQKILEYLETHCIEKGGPDDTYCLKETSVRYKPSYFVWRDLLRSLYRAARQESKGQFELVRRACRCLVNSSRDETHPDHFVLQAGLAAAEVLGDAKLASDMIRWAWENAEQFVETRESSPYNSGHSEELPRSSENAHADLDAELDSLFGTASIDSPKDDEVHQECHKQDDLLKSDSESSDSDLLSILDDSDPVADTPIEDFHFSASNEAGWFNEQEGESNTLDTDWFHSEHEKGPPRYFIHIPTKAYYSAIKICLANGEPELAHSVLKAGCIGPSDEVDMRLPDNSRTNLFNLVMSGYSEVGDFENAQSLLDEMQSNGPRPNEHTYAAFITSLAIADKLTEATNVIDSMLDNENGDGILPGSSSFGACMLAALKANAYQQVLDLNTKMLDAGISPNSHTKFGVVLASTRLGDRASALKAAESALESNLPINHQGLNLLLKALLPDSFGDGSIASIRSNLRSMGRENKDLAAAANALSRSLRMVETEERRPKRTKDIEKCEQMWHICLRDLCALVHQKDGI